jgi:signal transduction histidine kinase
MLKKINLKVLSNIVIVYMLCAFAWWSTLLYIKNKDAFEAKANLMQLIMLGKKEVTSNEEFYQQPSYVELKSKYKKQEWMILGEASIFISSLIFGIWLINRGHKIEVSAEQQTRNFLLSITHELKTPLASIKLTLETILKRDLKKESRDTLSRNAVKEIDRLNNLVNDLLLAAKVETFYQPLKENIDIQELLSDIIHDFEDRHENIQVDFDKPDKAVYVLGDKQGLESAFENLLENARKYSFNDVKIDAMLAQKDNKVLISFADKGIGIEDTEKKKVFEKFYRVGNEDTRKAKGTGLGLYIVHEIIKAHQGKINISDNQPSGTVFKIILPAVSA